MQLFLCAVIGALGCVQSVFRCIQGVGLGQQGCILAFAQGGVIVVICPLRLLPGIVSVLHTAVRRNQAGVGALLDAFFIIIVIIPGGFDLLSIGTLGSGHGQLFLFDLFFDAFFVQLA